MAWKVPDQIRPALAFVPDRAVEDALRAPLHLGGGAAREGEQQDAMRVGAAHHQMRDAMRERVGLARTGAGDDQQRARVAVRAVLDRRALIRIEAIEVVHSRITCPCQRHSITFRLLFANEERSRPAKRREGFRVACRMLDLCGSGLIAECQQRFGGGFVT